MARPAWRLIRPGARSLRTNRRTRSFSRESHNSMKKEMICIGLAICSLAAVGSIAQEADESPKSATSTATADAETDVTAEVDGKKQRKVRIERRLPGGQVEVEEFSEDRAPGKPTIRRRLELIDEGD